MEKRRSLNRANDRCHRLKTCRQNKQTSDYQLYNAVNRKISNIMKVSCDSSTMPASGTNIEPSSNTKLKLKIEEFKSNKIVNSSTNIAGEKENRQTDHGSTVRGTKEHEKKLSNLFHRNMNICKESKESGYYGNSNLDESIVSPQIIDNSAILFSNTKRRQTQLKNERMNNALNTEFDKSDHDYKSAADFKNNNPYENGEGEEDGEGESDSSSCS